MAHWRGTVIQGSFLRGRPPVPTTPGRMTPVLQRQAHAGGGAFPVTLQPKQGGARLPDQVRSKMESALGADFSDVRIHVGREAGSVGAVAFTWGSNIHFAPGHYNPNTYQGQKLLGHELTHVVQQRAGRVRNPFGSGVAVVQDRVLEAEADRMGERAAMSPPKRPNSVQAKRPTGPGVAAVQCFGWAITDSTSGDDEDIVKANLKYARRRYANSQTTQDPESLGTVTRQVLGTNEVVHIHGHGSAKSIGGFSPTGLGGSVSGTAYTNITGLAYELNRKFGDALRGRTIVLHGCEVGASTYGGRLLDGLRRLTQSSLSDWNGTTVLMPIRMMVVAPDDGYSYVALATSQASDFTELGGLLGSKTWETVRSTDSQAIALGNAQRELCEGLGYGWKGVQVVGGKITKLEDYRTRQLVIAALQRDENG